jgi:hypothetical protein
MQEVEPTATSPPPPRRVLLISAGASHSVALLCKLITILKKILTFLILIVFIILQTCPFDFFVVIMKICHLGCEKIEFLMEWIDFVSF